MSDKKIYLLPKTGNLYKANLHCHSTVSDGSFTPEELMNIDWLCDTLDGTIPSFEELLPASQTLVRHLGVERDSLQPETGEERAL